jgi:hypothetical protein
LSFRSVDEDEHDVNLSGGDEHVLSGVDGNDKDEWKQESRKVFDALKIYFILRVFWSTLGVTRFLRGVNRNFQKTLCMLVFFFLVL